MKKPGLTVEKGLDSRDGQTPAQELRSLLTGSEFAECVVLAAESEGRISLVDAMSRLIEKKGGGHGC